jgi:hypothetical protein
MRFHDELIEIGDNPIRINATRTCPAARSGRPRQGRAGLADKPPSGTEWNGDIYAVETAL